MRERYHRGRGEDGYGRSVQAVSRQRRTRARYSLFLLLVVLGVSAAVFLALLAWSYFIVHSHGSPWMLYLVGLCIAIWAALVTRLLHHLGTERDRLNELENREAQVTLFADRHQYASDRGEIDVHIGSRQEADSFERMMGRLEAGQPPTGPPDGEVGKGLLNEALSYLTVASRSVNHLLGLLRAKTPNAKPPLPPSSLRELPEGEPEPPPATGAPRDPKIH